MRKSIQIKSQSHQVPLGTIQVPHKVGSLYGAGLHWLSNHVAAFVLFGGGGGGGV